MISAHLPVSRWHLDGSACRLVHRTFSCVCVLGLRQLEPPSRPLPATESTVHQVCQLRLKHAFIQQHHKAMTHPSQQDHSGSRIMLSITDYDTFFRWTHISQFPLWFCSSTYSTREPLRISWTGFFYWSDVLPVYQTQVWQVSAVAKWPRDARLIP